AGVERLPAREAATRVVLRDPVDRLQPVGDDPDDGSEEQPIDTTDGPEQPDRLCGGTGPEPASATVDGFDRHQSEMWVERTPFLWKYFSNTFSAAGAAAVPPWPPFSIT